MFNNDTYALAVNIVSIFFLLGLSVLMFSTRKHHRTGVLKMILIVTTTVPIYIYNLLYIMRDFKSAMWVAPFAYAAGTAFMPLFWLFIHKYFNPHMKFNRIRLVHFMPTLLCFSIYVTYMFSLSFSERVNFFLSRSAHMSAFMEYLNVVIIGAQIIVYFGIIFIYIIHLKKFVGNNFSKVELINNFWIPRTLLVLTFFFAISLICHHLLKREQTWIINIYDLIVMGYFTIQAMATKEDILSKATMKEDLSFDSTLKIGSTLNEEDTQRFARIATEYINRSKCFLNPELDVKKVSDMVGISQENIVQSINIAYGLNFYELINQIRIERAVKVLKEDSDKQQTIETITFQSGFTSKEAFRKAFRQQMGIPLTQWLSEAGITNII